VLNTLNLPPAVLQAAAEVSSATKPAGQFAGELASLADQSRSSGSGSTAEQQQQQGQQGKEDEFDESDADEGSGFVDDYLKPPVVTKPLRPTVVYVTVPSLPRG
jgi:hypothetical protein